MSTDEGKVQHSQTTKQTTIGMQQPQALPQTRINMPLPAAHAPMQPQAPQMQLQYSHHQPNHFVMQPQMRPYVPYPTMPMSMGQSLSPLDEALKNAKCCLTCCDMKCGMPWLYGCAIGWAVAIGITVLVLLILGVTAADGFIGGLLGLIACIVVIIGMLICGIFGCIANSKQNAGMVIAAIIGNSLLVIGQLAIVISRILVALHMFAGNIFLYLIVVSMVVLLVCYSLWIYDQVKFYKVLNKLKQPKMMPHSLQMQQRMY